MFDNCIIDMGLFLCKLEPDIWIQNNGDIYEYIVIYVDYLAISARNPKSLMDALKKKHKSKLKGMGPIPFHLGCDFFCD